jgi:hypothetical protein
MIGGNVSTNAGGLRLLRYGSLHGSVLGLAVVLSDGSVLDCLTTLRKDNVGFDVKQLFIGAEGALGVVTRVALLAAPLPASVNVAMLGVASFEHCRALLRLARTQCGEILSAVEFSDAAAMGLALEHLEGLGPLPFPPASASLLQASGGFGVPSLVRGLQFTALGSATSASRALPSLLLPRAHPRTEWPAGHCPGARRASAARARPWRGVEGRGKGGALILLQILLATKRNLFAREWRSGSCCQQVCSSGGPLVGGLRG